MTTDAEGTVRFLYDSCGLRYDQYTDTVVRAELRSLTNRAEAAALERIARHLDAVNLLDIRPTAEVYVRKVAAKLRGGDGWGDEALLQALDEHENTPAQPRPRRTANLTIPTQPCHPGCDTNICYDQEEP